MKQAFFDIETTGLNSLNSRITCICAGTNDGELFKKVVFIENERLVLEKFINWIKEKKIEELVTANGKSFDLPFIFMRAYLLKIDIEKIKFLKFLKHFDIVIDITNKPISLNNLCKLYGLKQKIGTGTNAIKLVQEHKWSELEDYCFWDTILTKRVYERYIELNKKEVSKCD